MFLKFSLSRKSIQMIENICNSAADSPQYRDYLVRGANDPINGTSFINVSKDGRLINKFLFCPAPNGDIESIAIYGNNLQGHFNAIQSSMKIFGLDVKSIDIDSGYSDFVDVILEKYNDEAISKMISELEFKRIGENNSIALFSEMIRYKTQLQNSLKGLLSKSEIESIRASVINQGVIDKLIMLSKPIYNQKHNNETLYALTMSIGTILKEFEWGTDFVSPKGLYELAKRIIL